MEFFLSYLTPTMIFPAITLLLLLYFFITYWHYTNQPLGGKRENDHAYPLSLPTTIHPITTKDSLPILLLTALYALTAFWNLGATTNPQNPYCFEEAGDTTLYFSEEVSLSSVWYYPYLGTGYYNIDVSVDGQTWYTLVDNPDPDATSTHSWVPSGDTLESSLSQTYADLFKWKGVTTDDTIQVTQIRIFAFAEEDVLQLGELVFLDDNGNQLVPSQSTTAQGINLFDEWTTFSGYSSWFNSSYFDEIYHARTALEHLEGIDPYEISHPPLGKLILSIGISLFGMTPFGWRFMGTLVGVLMVPLLYLFLKNLFGRTSVATCGTALLATEFMHLTQTRIATIDSYGTFFILLMYYFLYRWIALPSGHSFKQGALPLLLSGLSFGLGVACKWTVLYGGIGLALLFFFALFMKVRHWPTQSAKSLSFFVVSTILFCCLTFAIIPAVIYTLSYLPYLWAEGGSSLSQLIAIMWDNQVYMFTYHSGITTTHPYSSRWYEWILNVRPILYYLDYGYGTTTAFGAFLNPVLCWGGLLAMGSLVVQIIRKKCTIALFIVVGYLSQLVPWMFISRTTFAYHYFPSSLFLVLAMGYVFHHLLTTAAPHGKGMMYGMAGGSALLYLLYYPVLVGITTPSWYGNLVLQWFPTWPF